MEKFTSCGTPRGVFGADLCCAASLGPCHLFLCAAVLQSFPGVKEMIAHYKHTPLLLIDATDQSSEAQNECRLLHPAAL